MFSKTNFLILGFVMSLMLTASVSAHTRTTSLGLEVGYFFPVGDWKEHRYATGADQFRGSVAAGLDLEVRLFQSVGVAANIGYLRLGVGDWEKYAANRGDIVDASASMVHVGVLIKPYLWMDRYNVVKLRLGASLFFPSGQESFDRFTYEYDFLVTRLGYVAGIEFDRSLNRNTALALRISGIVVPSGVQYADGEKHSIVAFPITLGVRFHF